MPSLHFEKIASTDRVAEPTSVGIPFPQGRLTDPRSFRILDGASPVPVQTRPLARWPDGSIRWLLAVFQPDLPGNATRDLSWDLLGHEPTASPQRVTVEEYGVGWLVTTGPLRVVVPRERFDLLRQVELNGRLLLAPGAMSGGFHYRLDSGARYSLDAGRVDSAEWVETGPLRACLIVKGVHGGDAGTPGLQYRVSMEFHAGKPWVKIQYQAVAAGTNDPVRLTHWGLSVRSPEGQRADRCHVAFGYYRCQPVAGAPQAPKEFKIDGEYALYAAFEHIPECYCGDFWADWNRDGVGGFAVSVYQALQNFPKALRSVPEGIDVDLLPAGSRPLTLARGVGKTHVLQIHFHPPEADLLSLGRRSFLFQLPDLPRLEPETYAEAGAFGRPFPRHRNDRIDFWLHHRAISVPRAFGMLHWGDYVEKSYTRQGRGRGRPVWCNGEYDVPHVYYQLHGLLGERWLRDYAAVAARHWMDVDFCHDSDDPLRRGGLIFHSADHVSGGVSICHEWLAGLLDHYHFTGDMEAREAAVAIGDNILRHLDQPVFRDRPTLTSTRTMGWALRALGPLWVETGDDRYRAACERIAEVFLRRFGQQGGIHDLYTEHNLGRVPFMIALSMESLRQWGEIAHDERIPRLIVDQARDLVDHAVGLGGLMYYKELPSLHVRHENPQALFPLAEAWRSTADPRFLQAAYRIAELMLAGGAREWDVVDKNLFEDALILEGQSWASYQIEPLLHFYAVLSDARDATGAPVLDGLDFRQKF